MSQITVPVLKTNKDYEAALERVADLWGAEQDTPEGNELDVLMILVEAYEQERYAIDPPDPVDAILFRLEQAGMSRKGLEPDIGSSGRVSEILGKKRHLTLPMIRRLHDRSIPAHVLVQDYALEQS